MIHCKVVLAAAKLYIALQVAALSYPTPSSLTKVPILRKYVTIF